LADKLDDIAALGASAAIPNLFFDVDAEAIPATADRARPEELPAASPFQLDATARDLVFYGMA